MAQEVSYVLTNRGVIRLTDLSAWQICFLDRRLMPGWTTGNPRCACMMLRHGKVFAKKEICSGGGRTVFAAGKGIAEIAAQRVWTAPNGDTLVDFGQNMAGVIRADIYGQPGEEITFEHGEVLDENGNFTYAFEGDETRAQKDCYICAGTGHEVFSPPIYLPRIPLCAGKGRTGLDEGAVHGTCGQHR